LGNITAIDCIDEVISFSKTYEVTSTIGKGSFGKVYRSQEQWTPSSSEGSQ
jgi:hypothetical protein